MSELTPETRSLRFEGVQVLRGIAAMLVVLHHFTQIVADLPNDSIIVWSGLGWLGRAGVDIFFVISGFVMAVTYTRSVQRGPVDFLRRRGLRIYPSYIVYTLAAAVLWRVGVIYRSHSFDLNFLLKSLVLLPSWNGRNYQPLIGQGWTLTFELYFYLCFAAIVLFRTERPVMLLAVCFGCVAYVSTLVRNDAFSYVAQNPLLIEFLFGMVAAECAFIAHRKNFGVGLGVALIALGVALLLLTLTMFHTRSDMDIEDRLRAVMFGAPSFLIVCGAALVPAQTSVLKRIGDASYSIYLTHAFVFLGTAAALRHMTRLSFGSGDGIIIIGAGLAGLLGCFLYRHIERPLTKLCEPASLGSQRFKERRLMDR